MSTNIKRTRHLPDSITNKVNETIFVDNNLDPHVQSEVDKLLFTYYHAGCQRFAEEMHALSTQTKSTIFVQIVQATTESIREHTKKRMEHVQNLLEEAHPSSMQIEDCPACSVGNRDDAFTSIANILDEAHANLATHMY